MTIFSEAGYREFLQNQKGLKDNTINRYCSGLRSLSRHCGRNLFELGDIAGLDLLIARYIQGGPDEEQGKYGNWAASNALKHWREYISQLVTDIVPRCWLLTWNPKQAGGDAGIRLGDATRWNCLSKQPSTGDHFYLIRLGENPRGIVARGVVTRASFVDADWRDSAKTRSYIEITAEEVRPDCASGLVPILLLQQLAKDSGCKWSAQSSGIEIPVKLASRLDAIWASSAGEHSLQQYLDWSSADPVESRPDWLPNYQQRLELAKQIKQGQLPLDAAALEWLWRDGKNGICSVRPAFLPHAAFEGNRDFLKSLTKQVMADQSVETYQNVITQWEQAKENKQFTQMYRGVIHRVFSAFASDIYTTLVMPPAPETLLKCFASDFQLPNNCSGHWAQNSVEIRRCIDSIEASAGTVAETNIALWQLFKAYSGLSIEHEDIPEPMDSPSDLIENPSMPSIYPLNQILFGPPGTGKTYHTINEALAILDPEFLAEQSGQRDVLKKRFDEWVNEGRVRFVTFHQSFSYEDFVEGLRADTDVSNGQIRYEVSDGVFKSLCEEARGRVGKTSVFDHALEQFQEKLDAAEGRIELKTIRGKVFEVGYDGGKTFRVFPRSTEMDDPYYVASWDNVRKLFAGESKKSMYNPSYVEGMLRYLQAECGLPANAESGLNQDEAKPYVLIIDEINRGNISRIFGELITLIEPSKRAGANESLSVTLPYSKDPFSVPDNVCIIGTMNTTDRSLAGLDIALRRRFAFKEMPPRPELLDGVMVSGVDIGAMLRIMNQRITVLLDRDHCLGHAYFMPLAQEGSNTLGQLAGIFKQNIIPLLQEYFFEDWERIRWVLNDQSKADADAFIVEDTSLALSTLFPNVQNKLRPSVCWQLNPKALFRVEAYAGIGSVMAIASDPAEQE